MPTLSRDYFLAWAGVLLLVAYYAAMIIALRWRRSRSVQLVAYAPPQGISPAVAAFLWDDARYERAFAAGLVSLAAKRRISVEQTKDWLILEKLRGSGELPTEETTLLESLFPLGSLSSYAFNAADCDRLCAAYRKFRTAVDGIANPALVSPHLLLWVFGIVYSIEMPTLLISSVPHLVNTDSVVSLIFCGVWAVLGASSLLAAVRVWPGTLRKLASFLPFDPYPSRPLNLNDLSPVFLTAGALMGFGLLASATATQFALLMLVLLLVHAVARHLLEVPTAAGRKALAELDGFKEFLSRAEADRMNRENEPGHTPRRVDEHSAYAVALRVENVWGEDFADSVIELLRYQEAYDFLPESLPSRRRSPELKLSSRKRLGARH
jgi:Predicted membrane protein (DUF2207)